MKKKAPIIRATTSASNFFRRVLCPGSGNQEEGLAEVETEYSGEGQMLHSLALTGIRESRLTADQIEALESADRYAKTFFDAFRIQFGIPEDAPFVDQRDVALEFTGESLVELFPGHADIVRKWPDYPELVAIVDFKFGWLDVDHAADNWQLAIYAVMYYQRHPTAKQIGVSIVQPRNFGPRFSYAVYSEDAIAGAMLVIQEKFFESRKKDAPLNAGDKQCHYCKAKPKCPAYTAMYERGLEPVRIRAIDTLTNDELIRVATAIKFAAKIAEDVSNEFRTRVEAGKVPGYKLQNTGDITVLDNPLGLYNALKAYFADRPEFTATAYDKCRDMTWGKLEELIKSLTGLSEKKVKEFIKEFNAPFVTRTPKAKRVVVDKEAQLSLQ